MEAWPGQALAVKEECCPWQWLAASARRRRFYGPRAGTCSSALAVALKEEVGLEPKAGMAEDESGQALLAVAEDLGEALLGD